MDGDIAVVHHEDGGEGAVLCHGDAAGVGGDAVVPLQEVVARLCHGIDGGGVVAAGGLLCHCGGAHHLVVALHRQAVGRSLHDIGEILPVVGDIVVQHCAARHADRHHTVHRCKGMGVDGRRRAALHLNLRDIAHTVVGVVADMGDRSREGQLAVDVTAAVKCPCSDSGKAIGQLRINQSDAPAEGTVTNRGDALPQRDIVQPEAPTERPTAHGLHAVTQCHRHKAVAVGKSVSSYALGVSMDIK